jgi:hypothetical protein
VVVVGDPVSPVGAGGDGTQVPTPHPLQHSHHDLAPTPTKVMLANHGYMLFSFVLPPLSEPGFTLPPRAGSTRRARRRD